ncbi:MAG: hypothetical protein HGGPFJEG_00146 [Ignavibacteria bacterium]|nr:hypothetical protein [Ignavibacteria bacterium]
MPGFFMSENFFILPDKLSGEFENFKILFSNESVTIERIISSGQKTPDGQWLEQERNEWVMLLQGESTLKFESGEEHFLKKGDYVFIPANTRHRVEFTSDNPCCIWIAVHF